MARVLELRAARDRLAREAAARAERAFLQRPRTPCGPTVPRPFALAADARAAERRRGGRAAG
jgi:hypothetical protein